VSHYSEDVVFGSLGLPTGFDDERLLVNLRGINRVRSIAGLGIVSVVGERGEITTYDHDITSMSPSGEATLGAKQKEHKVGLVEGNVTFPTGSSFLGSADTVVKVNTAEIDNRIRTKHGIAALYEAKPRAKLLNESMKDGLNAAVIDANMDMEKFKMFAKMYGFFGLMGAMSDHPMRAVGIGAIAAPVLLNLGILQQAILHSQGKTKEEVSADMLRFWKEFRKSVSVGIAVDRMALASLAVRSQRLIKAQT
jgi:hypothetical protein